MSHRGTVADAGSDSTQLHLNVVGGISADSRRRGSVQSIELDNTSVESLEEASCTISRPPGILQRRDHLSEFCPLVAGERWDRHSTHVDREKVEITTTDLDSSKEEAVDH